MRCQPVPFDLTSFVLSHWLTTILQPFKSFTKNPSWFIAKNLPETLSVPRSGAFEHPGVQINLYVYPEPVPVAYESVHTRIPPLLCHAPPGDPSERSKWAQGDQSSEERYLRPAVNFDHVLHIGMAGGRKYYSFETMGHRDGYKIKDVVGNDGVADGERVWKDTKFSKQGPAPSSLTFGYDEFDVWSRWFEEVNARTPGFADSSEYSSRPLLVARPPAAAYAHHDANGDMDRPSHLSGNSSNTQLLSPSPLSSPPSSQSASPNPTTSPTPDPSQNVNLKISHDAGHFLCDFIFFTSLAERWRQGDENPKVNFLHVPSNTDEKSIELGTKVAEGLIKAVVISWETGARSKLT